MFQTRKKLIGAIIFTTAAFSANNVWANASADIASGAAVGVAVAAAGVYTHAHLKTSSAPAETQSLADRRAALDDAISRARASQTAGLEPLDGAHAADATVAELDAGSAETANAINAVSGAERSVTDVAGEVPGVSEAAELGGDGAGDVAIDAAGDASGIL